ncbi:HD domain-containing phosphohydrolase [Halospina sp. K52047b]|uniref:HD-GYP domain-containing protein n=1 Tax=Halospina sp. K52047b TaxID=2614160 RepID=UPI001CE3D0A7|nr:HD domain-containing phosphohydrolase [Halospina sp. K52047b]
MSQPVQVAPDLLEVGRPLLWPLYNASYRQLAPQGHVIQTEGECERFRAQGYYHPPERLEEVLISEAAAVDSLNPIDPFTEYGFLLVALERALDALARGQKDARQRLMDLVQRVRLAGMSNPEACLALIHVYAARPSVHEQTLFYAFLCWFVGSELGYEEEALQQLVAAALSANIALMPFQDRLNASRNTLSEQQRAIIRRHPERSAEVLTAAGVADEPITTVIRQHHEEWDGSGYPNGLRGKAISQPARILAMAERYVALITRRAYRDRYRTDDALRYLLDVARQDPNKAHYRALYNTLTIHPPGALIQLKNGETAVVAKRALGERPLEMLCVANPQGHFYLDPILRRDDGTHSLVEQTVVTEPRPSLDLARLLR